MAVTCESKRLTGRNRDIRMVSIVRRGLLAASLIAIVSGWCLSASALAIAGAVLYVISSVMWYVASVWVMSRFRSDLGSGAAELKKYESRVADVLGGAIFLLGLGGAIYASSDEGDRYMLFSLPGLVIWLAEFCMYSLHGIVCEKFLGIRLTMRYYSGWKYVGRCR